MITGKARIINGYSSILLDTLRICAAFAVLYIHAFNQWFPSKAHDEGTPGELSHAAVIVFFVLSGYVIAHTTISKNRGAMQYALARLTRLGAVVIPALLITAVVQVTVGILNPQLLAIYSRGFAAVRYVLSGLFVNEFWFFSAAPPLNISLWSLSFEFWYYTIFGLWFFRKKGAGYLILPVLFCLLAGPKILLMMPIWLAGYFAYSIRRPPLNTLTAWLCVFGALLLAYLAVLWVPIMPYKVGYKPLYYANQFITDWIIGIFTAIALWILPLGNTSTRQAKWEVWYRKIADLTFPLYVLHYPLLVLLRCLFGYRANNLAQLWMVIVSVTLVSAIVGMVMEKLRPFWGAVFKHLLTAIKRLFVKEGAENRVNA